MKGIGGGSLRVGCVLVVKNEASDIEHWLSWHLGIGFTDILIYDDFSDDGTLEKIRLYAQHKPVTIEATKPPFGEYYFIRQINSYKDAIKKARGFLDWLCFIDADEFLFLKNRKNICDFLADFENADAVAINWCNYGSSGHVLKPDCCPVEAYTWHSKPSEPVNRHVKTILRPHRVGDVWYNVHSFDIDPSRYFLANGDLVRWGDNFGIIDREPDWSVAKIMHYQCRSMEHFVERAKKRPDLKAAVAHWLLADVADIEDLEPVIRSREMRRQAVLAQAAASMRVAVSGNGGGSMLPASAIQVEFREESVDCHAPLFEGGELRLSVDSIMFDIGETCGISEIRLSGQEGFVGAAQEDGMLAAEFGIVPNQLAEICRWQSDDVLTAPNVDALALKFDMPVLGRFVRLRLKKWCQFYLNRVDVFVAPFPNFVQSAIDSGCSSSTGAEVD